MAMTISTYFGGSCAAGAITNLGEHKNGLHAMKEFCTTNLGFKSVFTKEYSKLLNFYVFIAGPEVPLGQPGSSHHSKEWVKYGTEFALFIKENELGELATVGPKPNAKYHKTTTAQIWLWSPNQAAMEAWWDKNGGITTCGA